MKTRRILAIAKRGLLIKLRYKWDFVVKGVLNPVKNGVGFFVVYSGFFGAGAVHIGPVDRSNYLVYLMFGMIFHSFFNKAFVDCSEVFLREKFWQTIQGLLVSPAKGYEILLGYGLVEVIDSVPIIVAALAISVVVVQLSIVKLLAVVALLGLLYLLLLGIGFIRAGFILSDENAASFFMPFSWVLFFLSCFYYPIQSIPTFFHPLILANPVYHAGLAITSVALGGDVQWTSIGYLAVCCVVFSTVGALTCAKVWKREGIQGY